MTEPRRIREDGRYLPVRYPEEEPYWAAAAEGRLVMPHCRACGRLFFPVGPVCPKCLSPDLGWREMSGRGTVSSFVVYHKGWSAWLAEHIPYGVVQVELDEGPRLTTGLLGISADSIHIGLPVRATFEQVTDEIALLQFEPIK